MHKLSHTQYDQLFELFNVGIMDSFIQFRSCRMPITWIAWHIFTGLWLRNYSASFLAFVFSSLVGTMLQTTIGITVWTGQHQNVIIEGDGALSNFKKNWIFLWIMLLISMKCEDTRWKNKKTSPDPSHMCDYVYVSLRHRVRQKEKNVGSQLSLRESLVFLHEYLIDARSKIAWRETPKIKEGKPVTTEAGRQGRPEKTGRKRG